MTLTRSATLTPEISDLLALAMWPDAARIESALWKYASDPAQQIWAWVQEGQTVCAAGLRLAENRAEVLHLGTRPELRGRGFAKLLIESLMAELHLEALEAETDDSAAAFYRRCGFQVEQSEGRWGKRYRCLLTASASR